MPTETKIQAFVHALEEGGWASRIRLALLLAVIAAVYCVLIFAQFRGLEHPKAMDQAQIARELASGNGFSTKFIRPLMLWQFARGGREFPTGNVPDIYHAPLNPFINSFVLRFTKNSWQMTPKDLVYTSDRVIAAVSMIFFLLSVAVNFTIAKRLFDRRLALLGMGLILVADAFWRFSLSGLPQMLMLLIFSGCTYALVRAAEAREARVMREARADDESETAEEKPREIATGEIRETGANPLLWLILAGLGFGLLALAHGLTIWIFLGALAFVGILFWPRGSAWWLGFLKNPALVMLAVFLVIYSPWLVRNARVCGSPLGISFYSCLFQIEGSESQIMRSNALSYAEIKPHLSAFRSKIQGNIVAQFSDIFGLLGHCIVAPVFFLALLHLFKNPTTAVFRWCVLLMWLFALFGMAVFGFEEEGATHANDLHVLFIPLMIFYGLAFVLVLWTRLITERPQVNLRFVRVGFITLIYLVSALPFAGMLFASTPVVVQWPPYVPPFIAILNKWTNENEVITSDMPWAVAWYAQRKSLWLPLSISDFILLNDYNTLGGRIVGLYLTPVTGDKPFIADIMKGEYKDWAPFILRNVNVKDFPLRAVTALPIDNQCIFYADRDRWSAKTD